MVLVMVIGPYTEADNDAASVYAFPWMGPNVTSLLLIVCSFICSPKNNSLLWATSG